MPDEHTESLRGAERRLQTAQPGSDVAVPGELIDDSTRFTGPDGSLSSPQDDLRAHERVRQVVSRVEEEDFQVLATTHVGVTWFLGPREAAIDGQPLAARMRYTRPGFPTDATGGRSSRRTPRSSPIRCSTHSGRRKPVRSSPS